MRIVICGITMTMILGLVTALRGTFAGPGNNDSDDSPAVAIEAGYKCSTKGPPINLDTPQRVAECDAAKAYAKSLIYAKFDKDEQKQFACLHTLWSRESGWSPYALNASSGAYGISQTIPGIHDGEPARHDWKSQVEWGVNYIERTFDTPCAALKFWDRTDVRCLPKNPGCNNPYGKHWY